MLVEIFCAVVHKRLLKSYSVVLLVPLNVLKLTIFI